MTKFFIFFCSVCALLLGNCSVLQYGGMEGGPAKATGDAEFSADFALFRASEESVRIVLYTKFPNSALTFLKGDDGFFAVYDATAEVKTFDGKRVTAQEFDGQIRESSYEATHSQKNFHYREFGFELGPGRYSVTVTLKDRNSRRRGVVKRNLEIAPFPEDRLSLSSIVFAERVEGDPTQGFTIVPNPDRIYGHRLTELAFYYEVYAPEKQGLKDSLRIVYEIIDQPSRSPLLLTEGPGLPPQGGKFALSGTVPLKSIQKEDVVLEVRIIDREGDVLAERKGSFHILWPLINWGDDFELSLAQLELVASEEMVAEYEKVPPEEREHFLKEYWKGRDPIPQTEENELLIEFERRLRHAKDSLGGIWSDRGRVYVRNGPPYEIERRMVSDVFGYPRLAEVWIYLDPYREFVFIEGRLVQR